MNQATLMSCNNVMDVVRKLLSDNVTIVLMDSPEYCSPRVVVSPTEKAKSPEVYDAVLRGVEEYLNTFHPKCEVEIIDVSEAIMGGFSLPVMVIKMGSETTSYTPQEVFINLAKLMNFEMEVLKRAFST